MAVSKTKLTTLIVWAIAWAAAIIASAILLKGNPIKDWIQSALFITAIAARVVLRGDSSVTRIH